MAEQNKKKHLVKKGPWVSRWQNKHDREHLCLRNLSGGPHIAKFVVLRCGPNSTFFIDLISNFSFKVQWYNTSTSTFKSMNLYSTLWSSQSACHKVCESGQLPGGGKNVAHVEEDGKILPTPKQLVWKASGNPTGQHRKAPSITPGKRHFSRLGGCHIITHQGPQLANRCVQVHGLSCAVFLQLTTVRAKPVNCGVKSSDSSPHEVQRKAKAFPPLHPP